MCNRQGLQARSSTNISLLHSHDHDDNHDIRVSSECAREPSSACLWAMVNDFLEMDCNNIPNKYPINAISATASPVSSAPGNTILDRAIKEMGSIIESSAQIGGEEAKVVDCVNTALKTETSVVRQVCASTELVLPGVLQCLQRRGYNAGLCVTERKLGNTNGSLPPTGGHRFIDVILGGEEPETPHFAKQSSERLIVDVGFCGHFEIARPKPAYEKLMAMLPSTFIGKAELLQKVVRIMSQAARASLESQDMPIPPWRSFSFLYAKWFASSCTRIASLEEASHMVLNNNAFPRTNHSKARLLMDRSCGSDPANGMRSTGCWATSSVSKRFPSQGDGDIANLFWQPSTVSNQISLNGRTDQDDDNDNDNDDICGHVLKRRAQANVVSALALALAETRHTHMLPECVASAVNAHSRLQPSAGASVSVL